MATLVCLFSITSYADKCVYQAMDIAKTLMKKNRASFVKVEVDGTQHFYDGVNTDISIYRITGRNKQGKETTLTYELTMSNESCILTNFNMLGGD